MITIPRNSTESVPSWYQHRMGWTDSLEPATVFKNATAAFAAMDTAFRKARMAMERWWEANKQHYLCQPTELKEFRS